MKNKKVIVKEYFTEYIGRIINEPVNGFVKVEANGHQHEINVNELRYAK